MDFKRLWENLESFKVFCFICFLSNLVSTFDVSVKNTHSDKEFIYICITRELARNNGFKVLPKHPLSIEECKLLEYDEGFNDIDWDAMHTIGTDDYNRQVKMAECLTETQLYAEQFHSIYVRSEKIKLLIEEKLKLSNIVNKPPYVNVQKWF